MAAPDDRPLRSPLTTALVIALAIAALYFAKEILLPIALAALLGFLLTPLVSRLERWRMGRIPAVCTVVLCAGVVVAGLGWILLHQFVALSSELPHYRENLIEKVRSVRQASGKLKEVTSTIEEVGKELTEEREEETESPVQVESRGTPAFSWGRWLSQLGSDAQDSAGEDDAVEVKVVQMPPSPLKQIQEWFGPLVAPVTTAGIVIVLVIFILVQREDIRDRIIQLFGTTNLHATTEALNDAASRVSRYLRMNLLINTCYGAGLGIGLFLIGVPNAFLWGVLGLLLRFLPYLGPWIAGSMPTLLSLAVFDDWGPTLMVIGLVIVLELAVNNGLEPWLYGSSVGVSSLGIIVSAIFWTWVWGPVGLVLAVPLTVCLTVTGQYVPQLRFFSILFSDQSSLSPSERLYQRLLARDLAAAEKLIGSHVRSQGLEQAFDDVLIPALELAERDRHNGALSESSAEFILDGASELIDTVAESAAAEAAKEPSPSTPRAEPFRVYCIPAEDEADEVVAQMLAESLRVTGIEAEAGSADSLTGEHVERVLKSVFDVVVISVLPPTRRRNGRYLARRLRAEAPHLPVVIGAWRWPESLHDFQQPSHDGSTYVVRTVAKASAQIRAIHSQRKLLATANAKQPAGSSQ